MNDIETPKKIKRALITGSYRGTGKTTAKILIKEGMDVFIHGMDTKATRKTAKEVGSDYWVVGDLESDIGANEVFNQIEGKGGGIDILINNYGSAGFGKWLTTKTSDWVEMYEKNVLSAVRLIQLLVPEMIRKKQGRIIQIGTIGSFRPNSVMPHYYASKSAMANMTASLAKELANTGITVNTISPGLIKTPELEQYYRDKAKRKGWGESWDQIEKAIVENEFKNPVGRIGRCEDVGHLVAFLCSDNASFINGQNICVDGGAIDIV